MAGKRILIVDDDESLVKMLASSLSAEGFETCEALGGMSAIKSAYASRPDLIVLDVRMPLVDGFRVVERLKSSTRTFRIPILFLSALPKEDIEEKALRLGVSCCFAKPFEIAELIDCVHGLLGTELKRYAVHA
jgi:DNA-binding response OmpR family regulator